MMDLPLRQNDVYLVKEKVKKGRKARNVIRIFPFSSVGFLARQIKASSSVVRVFVMTMRTPLCNANRPHTNTYSQLTIKKKITIRRTLHNQSKQLYTNQHQI